MLLLEAVRLPVFYRWPKGTYRFVPGEPILVTNHRGKKILEKCGGSVRVVNPSPPKARTSGLEEGGGPLC